MSKPEGDREQMVSNGMVKNRYVGFDEWHSIQGERLVRLESGEWVPPEKAEELARHQAERKVAEQRPTPESQATFHLTPLSALLAEAPEDISYVWEDTLPRSGHSLLVAKPKVGKSTLARNLALKVAGGADQFLGRRILSAGPVVYLALEEKRGEVKKHFERMGAKDLPILIHTGSAPEKAIEALRRAIIESKAVLAVVDPLQRLVRMPDLNDYAQVSLVLEPLMQIARDTGCHIMLVHHANKGMGREGGDIILGSTAIFGSVDCALFMRRTESHRTIESQQRYGEDMPKTVLAFDPVTGLTVSGGSLEEYQIAECGKDILSLMADQEVTEKELKEGLTDYKHGAISKSLRALCDQGEVQRSGTGKRGDAYRYQASKDSRDSGGKDIRIPTIPTILAEREPARIPSHNAGDFLEVPL